MKRERMGGGGRRGDRRLVVVVGKRLDGRGDTDRGQRNVRLIAISFVIFGALDWGGVYTGKYGGVLADVIHIYASIYISYLFLWFAQGENERCGGCGERAWRDEFQGGLWGGLETGWRQVCCEVTDGGTDNEVCMVDLGDERVSWDERRRVSQRHQQYRIRLKLGA